MNISCHLFVVSYALLLSTVLHAAAPVYVALWFDTEDYIDPNADDAALRIASDLTRLGVRATFKVVGEKARVLESRKRTDVIRALSNHAIGYRRPGYLAEGGTGRSGRGVGELRMI